MNGNSSRADALLREIADDLDVLLHELTTELAAFPTTDATRRLHSQLLSIEIVVSAWRKRPAMETISDVTLEGFRTVRMEVLQLRIFFATIPRASAAWRAHARSLGDTIH